MYQAIFLFAAGALCGLAASIWLADLRKDLRKPRFWATLASAATLLSLASLAVAVRGHAGTGIVIRQGWPKPFYFTNIPEAGPGGSAFELIYFTGNTLVYASLLLIAWTAWRALRR